MGEGMGEVFEGDPDRITIGGDTAGASAVGLMLMSENTRRKGESWFYRRGEGLGRVVEHGFCSSNTYYNQNYTSN